MFRKLLFILFICFFVFCENSFSETIVGNVEMTEKKRQNKVIDAQSQSPIPFATVKIPTKNYKTKTDKNGVFELNADITGSTIMSVEKEGYRPFSVTIDKDDFSRPLVIGIEKTQAADLSLEKDVVHLGDNNYSSKSANSGDFRLRSLGPYFSKTFKISNLSPNENAYFVIGSVIGIDTLLSRQMGQSMVTTSYASPAQIYFNGQKIGELSLTAMASKFCFQDN